MAQPPDKDAPFFSRWSQRKRAVAEDEPPAPIAEPAPLDDDSITEEELASLPAIEDLTEATDIRPFLKKGVPQALRNAALRRRWMLVPAIRDYSDPAVDYAWDWNTPGGVPGDGLAPSAERTAQMLRDLIEPRRDAAEADAEEIGDMAKPKAEKASDGAAMQQNPPAPEAPQNAPSDVATQHTQRSASAPSFDAEADAPLPPRKRHGSALPG